MSAKKIKKQNPLRFPLTRDDLKNNHKKVSVSPVLHPFKKENTDID